MAEEKPAVNPGPSVETRQAERNVWLLKAPNAVAALWKDPPPVLGKLILSLDPCGDPDDPASTQFMMEVVGKDSAIPAKTFEFIFTKDVVPMHMFSETSQGKLAVEGKVEHKFDMKPPGLGDNEEYRKVCRLRQEKSTIKSRTVKRYENDRGGHMTPMPTLWSTGNKDKKRAIPPPKQPEGKRIRRERTELEDIVFKLFERQANWTLKQLVQETDQPVAFLKEVLNDLCLYNKRGANQGTYELKPEYKKTGQDEPAADVKDPSIKNL